MKITEVKVYPAKEAGRLKAYATIVFEGNFIMSDVSFIGKFIIRDLKIIQGHKGLFVSMPSRRRKDGTFRDVAHPLDSDMRTFIEESVLKEFEVTPLSAL